MLWEQALYRAIPDDGLHMQTLREVPLVSWRSVTSEEDAQQEVADKVKIRLATPPHDFQTQSHEGVPVEMTKNAGQDACLERHRHLMRARRLVGHEVNAMAGRTPRQMLAKRFNGNKTAGDKEPRAVFANFYSDMCGLTDERFAIERRHATELFRFFFEYLESRRHVARRWLLNSMVVFISTLLTAGSAPSMTVRPKRKWVDLPPSTVA